MVRTISIRASAGMRFKAKLHPTHPALRAVDESGFPPSPQASVDRSFDDGGGREDEAGDEQEILYPPHAALDVQQLLANLRLDVSIAINQICRMSRCDPNLMDNEQLTVRAGGDSYTVS